MLKFYNRETEIAELQQISHSLPQTYGRLTTVVGRRRVGKTTLLNQAFAGTQCIYLFANKKKGEKALAEEFFTIISQQLKIRIFGTPERLIDVMEILFTYTQEAPLTVIIDEFQDLEKVCPAFFSDLQNQWDSNKSTSMIHLICSGSIYSMMTKLFEHDDESLFGRATGTINLKPLTPSFVRQILKDNEQYSPESMLLYYAFSGGIPRYVEMMLGAGSDPWAKLISEHSLVIKEGEYRLVEDFGGERKHYFAILSAIANGYNTRPKLETYLDAGLSKPLSELDETFDIIDKQVPVTSKAHHNLVRYEITDPFLRFWFHFIHTNSSAVEVGNFEYLRRIINRDYTTFSGKALEGLFRAILAESMQFNIIGGYWDKTGKNEIDIVAVNEAEKTILIAESKRQLVKYKPSLLRAKADTMLRKLPKYKEFSVELACFSLDNFNEVIDRFLPD